MWPLLLSSPLLFCRFLLRKGLAADSLASVKYAVFGLGDSGYPKYNVSGTSGYVGPQGNDAAQRHASSSRPRKGAYIFR